MARIAGINLPNKPTWVALTYIHGIGPTSAKKICETTGVAATQRIDELSGRRTRAHQGTYRSELQDRG